MKMEKKYLLILLFTLGGCQNITTLLPNIDMINLEDRTTEKLLVEKLPGQLDSITRSLGEIKNNWKNNVVREYKIISGKLAYEVYAGEKLKLVGEDILKVEITSLKNNDYELILLKDKKDVVTFRSVYAGVYILKITKENYKVETVQINNKLKYFLEKDEIYDTIKKLYFEKNYRGALKGNDFYKLAFPEVTKNNEELNFIELSLLIKTGYIADAKKLQRTLKSKENLTEDRIIALFKNEIIINGAGYSPEGVYYKYSEHYDELKKNIKNHILSKNSKTAIETKFLENPFFKISSTDALVNEEDMSEKTPLEGMDKNLILAKESYEKERYSETILYLEKISGKQKTSEAWFLLGSSYWYLENHEKAISNYNNYIKFNEKNIRMAEALYCTAISQEKLGLKKMAENNFKKVKSNFPGTSWSRKSNISLVKLRK
jgi:tetratricopeptide (TPR) repeat protein